MRPIGVRAERQDQASENSPTELDVPVHLIRLIIGKVTAGNMCAEALEGKIRVQHEHCKHVIRIDEDGSDRSVRLVTPCAKPDLVLIIFRLERYGSEHAARITWVDHAR